jgi:hypothetical protein
MDMGRETIKTKSCKVLLDAFQFVPISRCNRISSNRGIFMLRLNKGKIEYIEMFKG